MIELKYFILKPRSKISDDHYARASRWAMREYAKAIDIYDSELAEDLLNWVGKEEKLVDESEKESSSLGLLHLR